MRADPAVLFRRAVMVAALAFMTTLAAPAAQATPAEDLIANNIHTGLEILNNGQLSREQRRVQFEDFLLGVTDMKRVALFTLGDYGAKASAADRDAFIVSFRRYAIAVYQSYLTKYAGQTLRVTGSHANAPGDDIVATTLADPSRPRPLEVDFRVRSDGPKPVIVDFSVAGIWLALTERDEFTSFLKRNGGDIQALTAHLDELRGNLAAAD